MSAGAFVPEGVLSGGLGLDRGWRLVPDGDLNCSMRYDVRWRLWFLMVFCLGAWVWIVRGVWGS
eukprot:2290489-Alexandrium_andersonii.AAC.1